MELASFSGEVFAPDRNQPEKTKTATFALGCFWGPDARFGAVEGVVRTRVGYAGGKKENPTYHNLGKHTETVQIDYDPAVISYADLLDIAWEAHDPRSQSLRRQYRNILFPLNAEQEEIAQESRHAAAEEYGTVKTEIKRLEHFWLAEDYHQKYHLRQHDDVLEVFLERYTDAQLRDSTVAARVNGLIAGYRKRESDAILAQLPEELVQVMRQHI